MNKTRMENSLELIIMADTDIKTEKNLNIKTSGTQGLENYVISGSIKEPIPVDEIDNLKKKIGLFMGILYIFFGILQSVPVFTNSSVFLLSGNPMSIFVLTVIGVTYLAGFHELDKGIPEGISYIVMGLILSVVFAIIYILVFAADAIGEYLIGSGNNESWEWKNGLRPELYLGIIPFFLLLKWKKNPEENANR